MPEPLKWCVEWKNLTRREKFLIGVPFLATEDRAYKDIVRQLEKRAGDGLDEWADFPTEVREMACRISGTVKSDGIWPSSNFLPKDPADIPFGLHFDFTDKWDFLPYSIDLVEKRLNAKMPEEFWDRLYTMNFGEAVTEICKRRAEAHGGDAVDADSEVHA